MKHLITASACLTLLLALIMQMVQTQVLYGRILEVEQAATRFDEIMETEGFSEKSKAQVRAMTAEAAGCSEEAVVVEVDAKGKGQYSVSFPLEEPVAFPAFWGIDSAQYPLRYTLRRTVRHQTKEGDREGA